VLFFTITLSSFNNDNCVIAQAYFEGVLICDLI